MAHLSQLSSLALQNIRQIAVLGDVNNLGLYCTNYFIDIRYIYKIEYIDQIRILNV